MTFLVCGEALWDLFAEEHGDGLVFDARPGGSPFNIAVALARLGQGAALLTGLSTDAPGERLLARLVAEGVDTGFIVRNRRPTALSLVTHGPGGAPEYAIYGERAADREIHARDLPELGPEVWGLHFGSFPLVVEPAASAFRALAARAAGRLIAYDANVRPAIEPDMTLWCEAAGHWAGLAGIMKASAEDIALLYPGAAHEKIAEGWLAAGARLVIVTRGDAGADAFAGGNPVHVPAKPALVVDTVGAGDAFMAGLIAGLAERGVAGGRDPGSLGPAELGDVLGFAASVAAASCARRGADPPRRAELPMQGD